MRNGRTIRIKDPQLQKIRNSLRDVIIAAVNARLREYRSLQQRRTSLKQFLRQSICCCMTCGRRDRDMVYNKPQNSWYCTECYEGQHEHARKMARIEQKDLSYEDKRMADYYDTFL